MLRARRRSAFLGTLVLMVTLAGCGGAAEPTGPRAGKTTAPDRETADCRDQWRALGQEIKGNDEVTVPSALPERWTSVIATVDYYATSAKATDCKDRLDAQRKAIEQLTTFSAALRSWDMEYRLGLVKASAAKYAASPAPKKGNRPKPKQVAAALKELTTQAPVATQQQDPAWQQAAVTEVADTAAVRKATKDLDVVSGESPAFRRCRAALGVIGKALAPVRKR